MERERKKRVEVRFERSICERDNVLNSLVYLEPVERF